MPLDTDPKPIDFARLNLLWPTLSADEVPDRIDNESFVIEGQKAVVASLYARGLSYRAIAEHRTYGSESPKSATTSATSSRTTTSASSRARSGTSPANS